MPQNDHISFYEKLKKCPNFPTTQCYVFNICSFKFNSHKLNNMPYNLAMKITTRPNILLITTDQQRWDTFGAFKPSFMQTPHLDHLAADGSVSVTHMPIAQCAY